MLYSPTVPWSLLIFNLFMIWIEETMECSDENVSETMSDEGMAYSSDDDEAETVFFNTNPETRIEGTVMPNPAPERNIATPGKSLIILGCFFGHCKRCFVTGGNVY